MKPFSAYAAYGKGVLARSDFLPMESMERVSWREAIFRLWNLWNPARAVRAPMNFAKFNFSLTSAISAYILRPLRVSGLRAEVRSFIGLGMWKRAIGLLVVCRLAQAQPAPRVDDSVDLRDLADDPFASPTSALEIESATSVCNDQTRPSGEDVDTLCIALKALHTSQTALQSSFDGAMKSLRERDAIIVDLRSVLSAARARCNDRHIASSGQEPAHFPQSKARSQLATQ